MSDFLNLFNKDKDYNEKIINVLFYKLYKFI